MYLFLCCDAGLGMTVAEATHRDPGYTLARQPSRRSSTWTARFSGSSASCARPQRQGRLYFDDNG
jgi:hypothetical protein